MARKKNRDHDDDHVHSPREVALNTYQSIIVGLLVFIIGLGVSYRFISNQLNKTKQGEAATIDLQSEQKGVHTVTAGETLWSIAEKEIGSGYNAADIAEANKLSDPDYIEVGTRLTIPEVPPIIVNQGEVTSTYTSDVTIKEAKYTIKDGDTLWDISVQAYGDGYHWIEIAQTNHQSNPDLIYAGDVLVLPGK